MWVLERAPSQSDCWEQWVNDYGDPLFRFAYTYVHDRENAQDIVQEALFRAWREQKKRPFRVIHAGWLYTVTRHIAIDTLRKRQRECLTESSDHAVADVSLPDVSTRLDVERTLNRMSRQDRESLWLFYYQQWSIETIAQHYSTNTATIKGRLYRARKHFERLWKEGRDEEAGRTI